MSRSTADLTAIKAVPADEVANIWRGGVLDFDGVNDYVNISELLVDKSGHGNHGTLINMDSLTYEERAKYACDVCGNVPDEDGVIEHGRGCYTQSEDGGGISVVEFDPSEKGTE